MWKGPLESVRLEESYSSRLKEVYKIERGPKTLNDLAQVWKQRLTAALQTEKGKESLDRLSGGQLVYGETRAETRHLVHLRSCRTVHVNCALDALIEGFFQDANIESSCPHCQENITLKMVDRRIVSVNPDSTALWLGVSPHGEGPTVEVLCPFINFFSSQDHARQWREKNPEQVGVLLTLSQAHDFITEALPHAAVFKPGKAE